MTVPLSARTNLVLPSAQGKFACYHLAFVGRRVTVSPAQGRRLGGAVKPVHVVLLNDVIYARGFDATLYAGPQCNAHHPVAACEDPQRPPSWHQHQLTGNRYRHTTRQGYRRLGRTGDVVIVTAQSMYQMLTSYGRLHC